MHLGGEPSFCPACTEAEEKPHLQPSSVLGPGGCSWDFWSLQRCLPLAGDAMVVPPARAFCSFFTAAEVVLRGPPWAAATAPHSVGGLGLNRGAAWPGELCFLLLLLLLVPLLLVASGCGDVPSAPVRAALHLLNASWLPQIHHRLSELSLRGTWWGEINFS